MRYIDADQLIKKIYPMGIGDGMYVINAKAVKFAIDNTPTADVVPKSEVEELKAIIVDHKANEERWQELYTDTVDKWEKAYEELEIKLENVRAEVAREIFEEIESLLGIYTYEDNYGEYISTGLADEFAELKKKYTEEKE